MKRILIGLCGAALVAACSREPETLKIPAGSQVSVQKSDGVTVAGRLVDVSADRVVLEHQNGDKTTVNRRDINAIKAADMPVKPEDKVVGSAGAVERAAAPDDAVPAVVTEQYREVTIPAGTVLPVRLETPVGSDMSRVEQPVHGTLRRAVMIRGVEALPAGTAVSGHVTAARRPGRVKGRGLIAMRFTQLDTPGEGTSRISTATVSRLARATKQKDALEIVAPAAGGAVLGRVVGGKSGARKGAVIGGAAGTGYVLSTRGEEVRLGRGASLAVRLTAPLTVRVPVRR